MLTFPKVLQGPLLIRVDDINVFSSVGSAGEEEEGDFLVSIALFQKLNDVNF